MLPRAKSNGGKNQFKIANDFCITIEIVIPCMIFSSAGLRGHHPLYTCEMPTFSRR